MFQQLYNALASEASVYTIFSVVEGCLGSIEAAYVLSGKVLSSKSRSCPAKSIWVRCRW